MYRITLPLEKDDPILSLFKKFGWELVEPLIENELVEDYPFDLDLVRKKEGFEEFVMFEKKYIKIQHRLNSQLVSKSKTEKLSCTLSIVMLTISFYAIWQFMLFLAKTSTAFDPVLSSPFFFLCIFGIAIIISIYVPIAIEHPFKKQRHEKAKKLFEIGDFKDSSQVKAELKEIINNLSELTSLNNEEVQKYLESLNYNNELDFKI